MELRDICPAKDDGEPIDEIDARACWTIGDFESRLAAIQRMFGGGGLGRIPLRDLFRQK